MLEIPEWLLRQMHTAAMSAYPNEGSGAVLIGDGEPFADREFRLVRMTNVSANPRMEFSWSREEMLAMFEEMDRTHTELFIVFHSHPETSPEPSKIDEMAAWYPGVHYVIFSAAGGKEDLWYGSYLCTVPGTLVKEEVVLR
jgi:proteasome lid subunit RPN8/RPN11